MRWWYASCPFSGVLLEIKFCLSHTSPLANKRNKMKKSSVCAVSASKLIPHSPCTTRRTIEGPKNTSQVTIVKSSNAWNVVSDQGTRMAKRKPGLARASFYTNLNSNAQPHALFVGKAFSAQKSNRLGNEYWMPAPFGGHATRGK